VPLLKVQNIFLNDKVRRVGDVTGGYVEAYNVGKAPTAGEWRIKVQLDGLKYKGILAGFCDNFRVVPGVNELSFFPIEAKTVIQPGKYSGPCYFDVAASRGGRLLLDAEVSGGGSPPHQERQRFEVQPSRSAMPKPEPENASVSRRKKSG
jgi:hypothetical protein